MRIAPVLLLALFLSCKNDSSPISGDGGAGGCDTQLVGTVYAPNGVDPVPNATVYVPSGAVTPFPDQLTCDLCGTVAGARASATTRADGGFTLTGVPAGEVTVVAELGRFRRVSKATVTACQKNVVPADAPSHGLKLPGKDAERAPEDRVPKIAVATGDYDQIECVLKRMGVEQFDLYNDRDPGKLPATIGELDALLSDATRLNKYNLLIVNCTKAQFEPIMAKAQVKANLEAFVGAGGRLYATDWAYDVINQVPQFAPFLCFVPGGVDGPKPPTTCSGLPGTPEEAHSTTPYDTAALVKDPTMLQWLQIFPNTVLDAQVPVLYNFVVVNKTGTGTTTWLEGTAQDKNALPQLSKGIRPLTVTFDYKMCGRVHYSTYNTEPSAVVDDTAQARYPNCGARLTFNAQERLLEYLMFTIAQCVGPVQ